MSNEAEQFVVRHKPIPVPESAKYLCIGLTPDGTHWAWNFIADWQEARGAKGSPRWDQTVQEHKRDVVTALQLSIEGE